MEPKQHDPNRVGDIVNKENCNTHSQGGAKFAPFENKSEQIAQIVQALEALTQDERDTLLQALGLGGGGVKSLQPESIDRRGEPRFCVVEIDTFLLMAKVVTATFPI